MPEENVVERALGAVIGSAVGDALGAPYEFGGPRPDAPCAMEGGGTFDWAPGEWTDDTQQAVAVLAGLGRTRDVEAVAGNLLAWFSSGPADVGNQTRAVLGSADTAADVAGAALAYQAANPRAAGNGALMRTGPVALCALGRPALIAATARQVSLLTHPHLDSQLACILWSVAIGDLIENGLGTRSFVDVLTSAAEQLPAGSRPAWVERIAGAASLDPASVHRSNGWVVDAFRAALACCEQARGDDTALATGLRHAARSGGDTDTVAAIAGALLGAAYGVSAIPGECIEPLHGHRLYGETPLGADDLTQLVFATVGVD